MPSRRIHWLNVLTVGGAGVLVGTEVTALTWAAGWAIGGLIGLGPLIALIMEIAGAGVGLLASYFFFRAALRVEPVLRHSDADAHCAEERSPDNSDADRSQNM